MKGEIAEITIAEPIDFLSMRLSVTANGKRLQLDNDFKIKEIPKKWNAEDVKIKKQPFTKAQLGAMTKDKLQKKFVDEQGITDQQKLCGDLNWIAQTVDPLLVPFVCIFGKYNKQPVQACLDAR